MSKYKHWLYLPPAGSKVVEINKPGKIKGPDCRVFSPVWVEVVWPQNSGVVRGDENLLTVRKIPSIFLSACGTGCMAQSCLQTVKDA